MRFLSCVYVVDLSYLFVLLALMPNAVSKSDIVNNTFFMIAEYVRVSRCYF